MAVCVQHFEYIGIFSYKVLLPPQYSRQRYNYNILFLFDFQKMYAYIFTHVTFVKISIRRKP